MAEFPLLPIPTPVPDQRPPGPRVVSDLNLPTRARQGERLQPVFQRLRNVFDEQHDPVTLREDPAGIAPERALVLEVAGSIDDFQDTARRLPGLEYLGDEEAEFEPDTDFAVRDTRKGREGQVRDDKRVAGRLYLAMPDTRALAELVRLWDRHQAGERPARGFRPWFDLFDRLRQLRAWGPLDRVPESTIEWLADELEARTDPVRVEIELWSYRSAERRRQSSVRFERAVGAVGGEFLHQASIPEIAYEAALVNLPAAEVLRLRQRDQSPLTVCDDVMIVRPQSTAQFPTTVDTLGAGGTVEPAPTADAPPIAALFDGVPVLGHRLLDGRVTFDDPDDLDALSIVTERRHGTEMASLILHGDRNLDEPSLQRPLYVRPVLYAPGGGVTERTQENRLLIDTMYQAVLRMKEGDPEGPATAPEVSLVNLSLGDQKRPFAGPMSPWGRLLDHLADRFGILFLVSAGNVLDPLEVPAFNGILDLERATLGERERAIFEALAEQRSQRTLFSPAEALNVITVGAWHEDAVDTANGSNLLYAPYEDDPGPNITSALGLGHRKVIKPDIFMPGGRELFSIVSAGAGLRVRSAVPGQFFGLKTAIPDADGRLDQEGLTAGTSAATALATRAAHRLFDALMDEENGAVLADVPAEYYGVVVKALLAHRAQWGAKGSLLEQLYGPHGQGQYVPRRDHIARVLGYGRPLVEEAMTCAANRATLIGHGAVTPDGSATLYRVPLPASLERVTEPRSITLTLAWFSPGAIVSVTVQDVGRRYGDAAGDDHGGRAGGVGAAGRSGGRRGGRRQGLPQRRDAGGARRGRGSESRGAGARPALLAGQEDSPPEKRAAQKALYANRRRVRGRRGRRLQRCRGEVVERTFAHMYETGGMRRVWVRGHENVRKRVLLQAAACNIGLLLRSAGVSRAPEQPSDKSVPRGSLFHVRYHGDNAVAFRR